VPDPNHTPSDPNFSIFGTFTNQQATGTATFTAPNTLPDPTKYPGLQIVLTAQSVQNTAKTGASKITLISGITVVLTPFTASVPTQELQQFSVRLTNDLQNKGVTWSLTQNVPNTNSSGTFLNYPQLPTCSPTCGTITVPDPNNPNVAQYTAPSTIPTAITPAQKNNVNLPQDVTIVATSAADTNQFTIGTITIVKGGPITFNGISPTIAPQGATLWDIYLNAPNISSSSIITLTDANGGKVTKDSSSGQVKILFPLPPSSTTSTTTAPGSTGARLRLNETDLGTSGPITVSVSDPAQPCNSIPAGTPCTATGATTFNIIPVRPTSTASVPDDVVQGKLSQDTPVIIDGGYFGPGGNLAAVFFDSSNGIGLDPNHPSTSRQLDALFKTTQFNSASPGLYTLSVDSRATPPPSPNNSSVTNIAVFPDYSVTPPTVTSAIPVSANAGTNPSAIDIDSTFAVAVVSEVGSPATANTAAVPSAVQFYAIGKGTLTPIDSTGAACAVSCPITSQTFPNVSINMPTGISVNRVNHTVAVVNYGDQTVTVLPIPVPGASSQSPAPGTPFTVDISNALQGSVTPAPIPYSIGVDPDSNLAIVAYSSTSTSSAANLGFIVNLNPDSAASPNPYGCVLDHAINTASTKVGQCLSAQVTLNNGAYPQVAVAPHGHLALVTPGGSGVVQGVDVTRQSSANVIKSSTLTAGLVTVTIDTTQCPPGVTATSSSTTNPCPLLMVPGNAGSVLITGVKPGSSANNALFNGVFSVNVLSSNSFSYVVPNSTVTDTGTGGCDSTTKVCAEVFYGTPDQIFPITATAQGVAINSVTHTAAIADANAIGTNGSQIWLLNSLDQSVTSFGFFADCTAFIPACPSSAELLATTDVAWQPYTNEVVSYNPHLNQVSISDPVGRQRYAFACNVAPSSCITVPNSTNQQTFMNQITLNGTGTATLNVQNGTTGTLNLFGGLAVDPSTNQAFVLMSGSGTIDIVDLTGATPVKPTHVSEVIVPYPTPGPGVIGGVPNALVPQATLTCKTPVPPATTCDLAGVQIFGSGFDSTTQVRLDGTSIPPSDVQLNSARQLTVTIPGSFLTFPHHYALDVLNVGSGVRSNAVDFIVVQAVDLSKVCTSSTGGAVNTMPSSVAIADQIANGPFSPMALVGVTGCNSVVALDINPTTTVAGTTMPNSHFGQMFGSPVTVGTSPEGIAISQPLGLAVVANNGSNTVSILDLTPLPAGSPVEKIPDVTVGTNPTGVAIDDATGAAIVANTGSNTISSLNLSLLFPSGSTAAATSLTPVSIGGLQQPLAVAIDPDRGTNNQGIAVVTTVTLSSGSAPSGGLAVVEIGFATPILSTTISSGFVSATPTGIVFDPTVFTGTANLGAFYANSSGTNTITEFNPDTGGGSSVNVGINPTSLAVNPQTGAILTSNSASNTISIVDTLSNPFKTHQTLGFPGSATFGVAIDQFTNLAVIVDQANKRVLLFPMPN
jgi:DNA-binding beta-propeller fold protein YncE